MNHNLQIKNILSSAKNELYGLKTPLLDAEILLAYVLNQSRTFLYTWPDKDISEHEFVMFQKLLKQRVLGIPIAYIVGHQEFWSLDFIVNKHVLIPRPETELLIEEALIKLPINKNINLLDLGTGSGAIAVSLAKEFPQASIIATDISAEAIYVAQQNAYRNDIYHVDFIHSHWFDQLSGKLFDAIFSNPPYVAQDDAHLAEEGVRYEPGQALISGTDGLSDIRAIISHSSHYLKKEGLLLIEHGYDQGAVVRALFEQNYFGDIVTLKDYAGCDRVSSGKFM